LVGNVVLSGPGPSSGPFFSAQTTSLEPRQAPVYISIVNSPKHELVAARKDLESILSGIPTRSHCHTASAEVQDDPERAVATATYVYDDGIPNFFPTRPPRFVDHPDSIPFQIEIEYECDTDSTGHFGTGSSLVFDNLTSTHTHNAR
jgi:hypothetical protein